MIALCQLDIVIVRNDFAETVAEKFLIINDVKFTSSTVLKSKHSFKCVYVPGIFAILK